MKSFTNVKSQIEHKDRQIDADELEQNLKILSELNFR